MIIMPNNLLLGVTTKNSLCSEKTVVMLYSVTLALQAELATLQSLLKGFSAEVMQLVLQMRTEQSSDSKPFTNNSSSFPAAALQAFPASMLTHQQPELSGWNPNLQRQLQQQVPAAARLQRLLVQTQLAFRRFMVINRLSHYQLNNCNIETGEVDAAAPAGHWSKVARVLRDG
jgi:hypothetical protein